VNYLSFDEAKRLPGDTKVVLDPESIGPMWTERPLSVADHAKSLSKCEPDPKASKHDIAEFASLVTGFDLTDYQKRTIEMMKAWMDKGEFVTPIRGWPSHPRYHQPIFTDFADAEARTLTTLAAVPMTVHNTLYPTLAGKKAKAVVMDIESYGFEDRWKVVDYHFPALTGRPAKFLDAAVTAIDRALERAPKIEVPADYQPPVKPTNNRAARRRAGRTNRG
jgi:hypothetical protein